MKRNTPLRRTAITRRAPMRRRGGSTSYSRRERDFEFMGWAKQQQCAVSLFPPLFYASSHGQHSATPCSGVIEADHPTNGGLSHKGPDALCIPLCTQHHRERTDHHGTFFHLTREDARDWRAVAIAHTQAAWSSR